PPPPPAFPTRRSSDLLLNATVIVAHVDILEVSNVCCVHVLRNQVDVINVDFKSLHVNVSVIENVQNLISEHCLPLLESSSLPSTDRKSTRLNSSHVSI